MSRSTTLASRAILSLCLMAGFYALAALLAIMMVGVLYALFTSRSFGFLQLKIAFVIVVALYALARAVFPKRAVFIQPGPRLTAETQPALFPFLQSIAKSSNQSMPAEVYLLAEVNAFVMQKGGFMGLGGTRVMGIGLPLFQTLNKAELGAVIAHEFGHFAGGDTRLDGIVYQARQSLIRAIQHLAEAKSIFGLPFQWYAALFFRISHGVSRKQELAADAHAASLAGREAMMNALRQVGVHSIGYSIFLNEDVSPTLRKSFLPSLASGYSLFMAHKLTDETKAGWLAKLLQNEEKDPYDTHPPLAERLNALSQSRSDQALPFLDDTPAWTLLHHAEALNADLVSMGFDLPARDLQPLDWKNAGEKVVWAEMQSSFQTMEGPLHDVAFKDWIEYRRNPERLADKLKGVQRVPLGSDDFPSFLGSTLYLWVAHFAHRQGWRIQCQPGQPVLWRHDDQCIDFGLFVSDFAMDIRNETDWMSLEETLTFKMPVKEFENRYAPKKS